MAALNQDGWTLVFASDDLKKDKEILMAAVKQIGGALQFTSEDMKRYR